MKNMKNSTWMLLISLMAVFSGCTYNAKVSDSSLTTHGSYGQKSPKAITLIDNRDALQVSTFKVSSYTGNVDAREAFFNSVKSMLATIYSRVDVSTSPKPNNELYAVASYDTKLPDPGPVTTSIANNVRLEVYDTATKNMVNNFDVKKEGRAGVSPGLGILTGATLFILSPITIPMTTNGFGTEGEAAIVSNLQSAIASIRSSLATNP